jgi:hypothetical protein
MKRILLIFLFLFPVVCAQEWVYNSDSVQLDLKVSGTIELISTGGDYEVDYVTVNVSYIPKNGLQEEILEIGTEPSGTIKDGVALFRWDNPSDKRLNYMVESTLKSYNKIIPIDDKVNFPLKDLPQDVMIYTRPSKTIDSDDKDVIRMASEIIKGEDDLFVIEYKLGDWTKKNIEYDLSTLTASVTQKASWVLEKREGVCDELTNLFIAMNRALGIPAKFISGVAYTNAADFKEGFGPHGWAEVYFPGYGWVPFDVTYGEFGFVDAGHVKLKEGVDADEASTKFQWLGRDVDIDTHPLDIEAHMLDAKGRVDDVISLAARAVKPETGFGSYNLIEVTFQNLEDQYVATEIVLSKSLEIDIIGDKEQSVLLRPGEKKKVYWVVKVKENLERGYIYTFPFVVSSTRNATAKASFNVIENAKRFSQEGMENLIEESEEQNSLLGDIQLDCSADEDRFYEYETSKIVCDVKNVGNIFLDDLNVCLENSCKQISLGITQQQAISFGLKPETSGAQEVVVTASNKDIKKSAFIDIVVYDRPSIEITNITYSPEVSYNNTFEISFVLKKKSSFPPYYVNINLEPVSKEWEINQLNEDRKFIIKMRGSELNAGENNFEILITYKDLNGKQYLTSDEFTVNLINVNIFQRIALFFRGIIRAVI